MLYTMHQSHQIILLCIFFLENMVHHPKLKYGMRAVAWAGFLKGVGEESAQSTSSMENGGVQGHSPHNFLLNYTLNQ